MPCGPSGCGPRRGQCAPARKPAKKLTKKKPAAKKSTSKRGPTKGGCGPSRKVL